MTNKELLELAAKAAGIEVPVLVRGRPSPWHYIDDKGIHKDISCGGDGTRWNRWNPLEDDGDALRLAVKLHLWEPIRLAHRDVTGSVDIYAAARLAITRAAAESAKVTP